jgi:hypothetical protein
MLDLSASPDIFCVSCGSSLHNDNLTEGGDTMDKFYAFVSKVLLLVGLISLVLAVIVKLFEQFAYCGIFPLSYLRFAAGCFLFVIASSLAQKAGAKPQKKRRR